MFSTFVFSLSLCLYVDSLGKLTTYLIFNVKIQIQIQVRIQEIDRLDFFLLPDEIKMKTVRYDGML